MRGFLLKFGLPVLAALAVCFIYSSNAKAATYTVINTSDAGAGSLRQAIIDANTNPGADTVEFNVPGAGVHTITPTSKYPDITETLEINGLTQPGATCGTLVPASLPAASNTPHNLLIEINAINMTDGAIDQQSALRFAGTNASNSSVRGLVINQTFDSVYGAIMMRGDVGEDIQDLTVECNYLGVDPTGTSVPGGTYGSAGVWNLDNGGPSTNLFVRNNLIAGVVVSVDSRSTGTIENNLFCTNASGTGSLGNSFLGPSIEQAFYYSATTTVQHNIASGCSYAGISNNGVENAIIDDNYAGVDITGTNPIPNGNGINIAFNTSLVTNNLIAGNSNDGLWVYQTINGQVDINNNRIGVDANNNPMGNGANGIEMNLFNDSANIININNNIASNNLGSGGIYTTENSIQSGLKIYSNTVESNLNAGIAISHHNAEIYSNTVTGNNDGLGITNTANDLFVHDNNFSNNIGAGANVGGVNHTYSNNTANNNGGGGLEIYMNGPVTVTNNTADNNTGGGISVTGTNGTVSGNTTTNNDFGISVGMESGIVDSNISTNNVQVGISLTGTNFPGFTASNNQAYSNGTNGMNVSGTVNVVGNFVGVDNSNTPLGNGEDGIFIQSANNSTIGGSNPGDENQIAANGQSGIHIYGCQNNLSWGNQIIGNNIGVNSAGTVVAGYGNGGSGIEINEQELLGCGGGGGDSIYKNIIGGDSSGQKNIIAGNAVDGIRIYQSPNTDVFSNAILPNQIFQNGNLGINLAADTANSGNADTDLGPNALNNYIMTLPTIYANNYFNHPVIVATPYSGNQLTVQYNYNPNQVDNTTLSQADVVGYRLDFYLNDGTQDGAYTGYSQGKTHLGSIIVDGPESNATHTFTSPVPLNNNMSVNATATMLWLVKPAPSCTPPEDTGPPYRGTCI